MNPIYYGWWIVLASFITAFYVAGTIFYGFTAFIEPLANEFGWSYTQISLAASLRGLEMGLLAPFVGILVDRFGSRKLLLSGSLVLGFGIILLGFTKSLAMFYGAFILIAFGAGGCTSVVTMTAVANWFDKNVGKAMGLTVSGFGASGLIIPLIVWMIAVYGWRRTLIILGIGMWIIGVPAAFLMRNRPEIADTVSMIEKSDNRNDLSQRQSDAKRFRYTEILKKKVISVREPVRGDPSYGTDGRSDSYHAISEHHGYFKDELRFDGCRDSAVEYHRSIWLWLARRHFRKKVRHGHFF